MRRGNSSGSIYKMKGKLRNPWRVMISTGRDKSTGNMKRTTLGYYPSRQQAEAALAKYLWHPSSKLNITLGEMREEWKARKYNKISKQTQYNYDAAWLALRALERFKVRDIRSGHLQEALDDSPGGESTKKKIRSLAVQLWDYAIQNDIVETNYAKFLDVAAEEKAEKRFITAIERKKLENLAAQGDEIAAAILIMCYTGFRINEFLGLTPFSVVRENGRPIAFQGGLKTVAGKNRIVPIHSKILPYVEHWLKKEGEYIFCREDGKRFSDKDFRQKFKDKMAEIGITGITPHATRHTFFSMADEAKISQSKIMKIGGHSDLAMTKHYTHTEIGELVEAINALQ